MREQKKQSLKDTEQVRKCADEEADLLAKEQMSKKAYLTREQVIKEASKAKETRRAERRVTEDIEQSGREQQRRKAFLAREKTIAEAQAARKLKAKKQP